MQQQKDPLELARERGLVLYSQEVAEDVLLLKWLAQMAMDEEFLTIFDRRRLVPSVWLELFEPPTMLFYKTDPEKALVRYAAWLIPAWFGGFGGVWVEKDLRSTHRGLESFLLSQAVSAIAFQRYAVLGGITSRGDFLERNKEHGYVNMGKLPWSLNGEHDQYLVFYTKEVWEQSAFNPFREGE